MLIKIINGSVTFGNNTILESINFELHEKEKIAIVGRNGCGKSTLLNALINPDVLEEGIEDEPLSIEFQKNIKIGYLEQTAIKNEENTLEEELLSSFDDLRKLETKIKSLEENMTNYELYDTLMQEFKQKGGYNYLGEINKILPKFGFCLQDKEKKIKEFSGGQRTKIAFIKLLLSKPNILILDEPTNHLDMETIEWLEEYLSTYPSAVIIVSHDRMFLDNIVNRVYEIEYGSITEYKGNYTAFERQKEENYRKNLKDYNFQQKEIKRLQAIADRFRYKPSKASMAMSKLKKIEQMIIIEKPEKKDTRNAKLDFKVGIESGDLVLSLKKLEIGYEETLATISLELHKKERLAILGPNGCGKSTLLKTIMEKIPKKSGGITFGYHVKAAYFDQQLEFETMERTVLEEMQTFLPEKSKEQIRAYLGAFLFTEDDVFKKIKVLSGGEKVRLELAKIITMGPNLLILDEPTNHVDLLGRKALETCLKNYNGTILFVSHDRYFVNEVANCLLIMDTIPTYFRGTYQEYVKEKKKCQVLPSKTKVIKSKKNEKNQKESNKELKKIELEISKLEKEVKQIDTEMLKKENYSDYKKAEKLEIYRKECQEKLEEMLLQWEEMM